MDKNIKLGLSVAEMVRGRVQVAKVQQEIKAKDV